MIPTPALSLTDYATILGAIIATGCAIGAGLWKIRTNDLHHLDAKIDTHHEILTGQVRECHDDLMRAVSRIEASVARVENKIDGHVQDHAVGAFDQPAATRRRPHGR